jgi:fatty-acyl-CoA synthase
MDGLMQREPLLIRHVVERAERVFAGREIVSARAQGEDRSTYSDVARRARRLAGALADLGVEPGDRVGTFGWNSVRHLELYLAVPAMGAVLHTLNIRLHPDDLEYIAAHAEDKIVFCDASLAETMPDFEGVERVVLMPDGSDGERAGAMDYEELLAGGSEDFEFPELDENSAAAMCYTSGTTGRPKGVVYSHRSTILHSLAVIAPDAIGISSGDSLMPVVPMFHANAWGVPYAALLAGARLVLPGPRTDPRALADLIAAERVTKTMGVPTIWQGLLALDPPPDLSSLKEIKAGGSAVPESLMRAFDERFGVPIVQGWGMTETSPLAGVARATGDREVSEDEAYALRATQGRPLPLVQTRTDEEAGGELQLRGPWIASAYYGDPDDEAGKFTEDGWLRTGDVAELSDGYVRLVDRTKDLVKSGGEWISSVDLENAIMAHPDIAEAAVIAVPDERWGERPCACVVPRDGAEVDGDAIRSFLSDRVAKWWLPERIELIDEVPKTSVGKFDKKALRARFSG